MTDLTATVIRLLGAPVEEATEAEAGIRNVDVYTLPEINLSRLTGIIIAGNVDQLFLAEQREQLSDWVRGGGRMLINGHVQRPFLEGLGTWRKLEFHGPKDLALTAVTEHPVWAGVDLARLQFSLGADRAPETGLASYEQLHAEGVAGFYGRGYVLPLPEGARCINGLGPLNAPVDMEYPLGEGLVLLHSGNDLEGFATAQRGSAHLLTQLQTWLSGTEK